MQPCAHARMHALAGTVRTVRPVQRRRIQRKIPRRARKRKRVSGRGLASRRARARHGGQTPAPAGRTHAHLWKQAGKRRRARPAGGRADLSLSLSDMSWRLVAGGEASRGMRAGPRVRLRVPILPASNRAQGYAGSGGSLGLPALQYSGAG